MTQLNKKIDESVELWRTELDSLKSTNGPARKMVIIVLREMRTVLQQCLQTENLNLMRDETTQWKVDDTSLNGLDFGRVVLTNYRMFYILDGVVKLYVPYSMMQSITKIGGKKYKSKMKKLEIVTKDQRFIRFIFKTGTHRRTELVQVLPSPSLPPLTRRNSAYLSAPCPTASSVGPANW